MSNEMNGNSKAELLQWMAGGNKTFGWGALVAMDRSTVNQAFREQYITGFSNDSYMPAISTQAKTGDNTYVIFDQCVLSAPMLSFLDAKITDSTPVGNLTMEVVGGREMTLLYSNNENAECRKLIQVNALNPTTLAVKIALEKKSVPGSVGTIVVDLKNGTSYDLSSSNSALESLLSGAAFQKDFATWPDAKRIWEINKLVTNEGGLSVEDFEIRCQRAPGAASRTATNYGDGAIVVFVQTKDTQKGAFPSTEDSLRYLVPTDDQSQYTVTTVVSRLAVLVSVSQDVFRSTGNPHEAWVIEDFVFRPPRMGDETLDCYAGMVVRLTRYWPIGRYVTAFSGRVGGVTNGFWQVDGRSIKATLSFEGEKVRFDFGLFNHPEGFTITELGAVLDYRIPAVVSGSDTGLANLSLNVAEQSVAFTPASAVFGHCTVTVDRYAAVIEERELVGVLEFSAELAFHQIVRGFGERTTNIALLPLNSLLFQGPYANRLSSLHIPHDMALFGHVAPEATALEITTPLLVMGAGRSHQFAISGSNAGVTWSVDNLPGETQAKGSIDTSGRYIAPAREQINDVQVRVKITARKAGATASALVTVVRKEINVNPLVQFVTPGSTCELVAGSLGASRTWEAIDPAQGELRDNAAEGRDKTFVAPAAPINRVTLDLVPINVTSDGVTETAYVGVVHNNPTLTLVTGPIDVAARRVKLAAMWSGEEETYVTWEVIAGSGTIDVSTGELVADEFPSEPFVLVVCTYDARTKGYLLLPLPLAPYPKKSELPETFQAPLLLS
jgi:hypothetical protein